VALVEEPHLRVLYGIESVCSLAEKAADSGQTLPELIRSSATDALLDYTSVYHGQSPWRLLPPIDHPQESTRCLVTGTGLTHLGSAKDRQAMHSVNEAEMNDSMKMFRWGVDGGRPEPGKIGTSPEWFYKGTGSILRAQGEPLDVPPHGEDGGEEAEIAGVYMIDPAGRKAGDGLPIVWRLGMAAGNEFSDHKLEKRSYLYLAGSKLRSCAIGPELVVDPVFRSVPGAVSVERGGKVVWSQAIRTGEDEMCHSLANMEHHHFKFEPHRRPGDLHVHFFGAVKLSFGASIELANGDEMVIQFEGFGRPLRNPIRLANSSKQQVLSKVRALGQA